MAINLVDYEVLAQGQATYAKKAGELGEILNSLNTMNSNLMQGWQNDTARAFVDRFNSDHKVAIEKVIGALNEISDYIQKYSAARQEEDAAGAGAVRG